MNIAAALRPASSAALVPLLFTALFLSYVDRGLLPLAGPLLKPEFGLSATEFGFAVSAFFWVYAPAQLVGGAMVDRWPARLLYGWGVAVWGLATLAFAFTTGLAGLIAVRLALGLGQSFLFTAGARLLMDYRPLASRGRDNGAMMSGLAIGGAVGNFVGGLLMAAQGWRITALVFGVATLAWLLPWRRMRLPEPAAPPPAADTPEVPVTWRRILARRAPWGSAIGHFCNNWGFYFTLTWLPLYLVAERGFSVEWMAVVTALGFLVQFAAAILFGWATDRMIAAGRDEPGLRKAAMVLANIVKAAAILWLALAPTEGQVLAAILLSGAMMGVTSAQTFLIPQIFAGRRACGRWVGIQNFGGNMAGIIGPIVTGRMIDASGTYVAAFWLAAAITLGAAACWAWAVPRFEPVDWD